MGQEKVAGRCLFLGLALQLLLICCLPCRALAGDNLFNSTAVIGDELSRVGGEAKAYVKGPVDPYLWETLAVAGAFAATYSFDTDIRSKLASSHTKTLGTLTDIGSLVGDPYIHLGLVAVLYSAGAVAESQRAMTLGEKLGEALVLSDTTTWILKNAVGRGRPVTGQSSDRFRPFQFKKDFDSLSSMHTASSFAVAHVLAQETESLPVKVLCYSAAGFVGFSRVYKEAHWASDVVLGAAIGELAGITVTSYRSGEEKKSVTIAPSVSGGVPMLALVGRF